MLNWQQDCFAGDCIYVHKIKHREDYLLTYYDWCLMWNKVYWIPALIFFGIPNFGIGIPICQFFISWLQKKNPTKISGIKNGIGILLPMGVPEIGTENQNFQPSLKRTTWVGYSKDVCPLYEMSLPSGLYFKIWTSLRLNHFLVNTISQIRETSSGWIWKKELSCPWK